MKERPILFSGPMVRAILEGRKTMTRRVVKFPESICKEWAVAGAQDAYDVTPQNDGHKWGFLVAGDHGYADVACPYGAIGDRLWVRETFTHRADDAGRITNSIAYAADGEEIRAVDGDGFQKYRKDGSEASCWIPGIFMPRWASRITLEVKGVRVERLNEISEQDAMREGVEKHPDGISYKDYTDTYDGLETARHSFMSLWEKINGRESWDKNPWVWVVEFVRVES